MSNDIAAKLRLVRRYTGEAFSPSKGYDARKPLSYRRRKTIDKYFEKIQELTKSPNVLYKPKRGEKKEAFAYTGQDRHPRFQYAIVRKYNPESNLKFEIDRNRPRGSQFVAIDRNTGQTFVHIPSEAFLFVEEDTDPETYVSEMEAVIQDYAPNAEFFLINAGDSYMWGAGGGADKVADKIAELFRNYSAAQFDPADKNSSYYGNWFRGVTGFSSRYSVIGQIGEALKKKREYRAKYKLDPDKKARELRDGSVGIYENGRLVRVAPNTWTRRDG